VSSRRWILLLLTGAAVAGIVVGRWFFAGGPPPAPPPTLESGTFLSPSRPVPAFALVNQDGAPAGPAILTGHWTLVFFGFTHCPEACPTTLALLASLRRELAARVPADRLPAVLLVSVDPERDTPEVLKQYLAAFDPAFSGLTGSPDAMREFAAGLGMLYWKVPVDGDYMMDHSTAILLVNPEGRLTALFSAPHVLDVLARDYRRSVGAS
jgi:protein SCO1/2